MTKNQNHLPSCFCKECRGDLDDEPNRPVYSERYEDANDTLSEWHEIVCDQIEKMIWQLTNTVRKANRIKIKTMPIPKPTNSNKNSKSTGKAPAPSGSDGGDFNPWLKVNVLLKQKILRVGERFKMQVIEARESNGDYSDVFVDVKIKGHEFTWGLTSDKKAYAAMYEKFGSNLSKWKGMLNCELKEPFRKGYNPSIQVL